MAIGSRRLLRRRVKKADDIPPQNSYTYTERNPTLNSAGDWIVPAAIASPQSVIVKNTATGTTAPMAWSINPSNCLISIPLNSAASEGTYTVEVKGERSMMTREVSRRLARSDYSRSGYTSWLSGHHHRTNRTSSGVHVYEVDRYHAGDLVCRPTIETTQGWGIAGNDDGKGMAWNRWAMRTINVNQIGLQVIGMALYPSSMNAPHDTAAQADIHQRIIDGEWDWVYTQIAQNLIDEGLGTAIVRIDWEANGTWYYHATQKVANASLHGKAVAHVAEVMLDKAPGLRFSLDVSSHVYIPDGTAQQWLEAYYPQQYASPGRTVCHLAVCDIYFTWDKNIGVNPTYQQFLDMLRPANPDKVTLAFCHDFAVKYDLPLGIGEWGIADTAHNGTGDAPAYIQHMHKWMSENDHVAYDSYWILGDSSVNDLQTDLYLYPNAKAMYESLWRPFA